MDEGREEGGREGGREGGTGGTYLHIEEEPHNFV